MRLGTWTVLLWMVPITSLTYLTERTARTAQLHRFDGHLPVFAWILGSTLLFVGTKRSPQHTKPQISWTRWWVFAYAIALGVYDPVFWIEPGSNNNTIIGFVLLLAPFAWVAISGTRERGWAGTFGAWLLMFGQFFSLMYNIGHWGSGIGTVRSWIY
jgi:hypothetical protein